MVLRHIEEGSVKKAMKRIVTELLKAEPYFISAMTNITALIMEQMPDLNWVGFYLVGDAGPSGASHGHGAPSENGKELILGPFQGSFACMRIGYGSGVCGTAWKVGRTVVVPDVEEFPGHIACSSLSKSEIVVPVFKENEIIAVLDIDSDELATFDSVDAFWLERLVRVL